MQTSRAAGDPPSRSRVLAREVAGLLSVALASPSLGCVDFAVKTFDAYAKTMETLGNLDPTAVARGIDSLPFEVYLPDPVLGTEPDFYIHDLSSGEHITLVHDHETGVGGSAQTLRVQIFELPRQLPPKLAPMGDCELGRTDPRICPVLLTTAGGRVVHRRYVGSYPTNLSFVVGDTLIQVSLGRHAEATGWSRVELSPREIERFVDAFDAVPRHALYGLRVQTTQDL